MCVVACAVPYLITLLGRKSIMFKLGSGYMLYTCMDALYDLGIYTYFFLHGPFFMRKLVALEPTENFSSIQTRLFMRYCASKEIKKATGEVAKVKPLDLVLIRSFKN